jgi:hypothetical protein
MIRMKSVFVLLVLLMFSTIGFSQPIPPTPTSPLGGGLGILLVSGLSYFIIRFFKKKK